ncbi:DUF445 domain-containing protein [Terribacillus saccharophilus]|uniref:DUF445 domain-containing protein n=1 Tax=Terribacillus saccharophilus TaxID=361277 RepID=A0ABX4GWS3_9BACI|nr:DUF445 family protein [Terribacillus saccharophilus]PAD35052.1 hypothetical protein CHH56_11625 [Terribacillus saccharophilus]PAD95764.1 hypothetical protein CHH50_11855 [Terribacillus saccharophilus]PAD99332.1 hypothetical protein CHH48_12755 [Terribacillus saccharophilus]
MNSGDIWLILSMALIGALIGGITNHLAIKMLFKPHRAIYIGKWRLPFTPGLIPKRRSDLARSLGKTVVDHLLTPKGMQARLIDDNFQMKVNTWAKRELFRFLRSERTPRQLLSDLNITVAADDLHTKTASLLKTQLEKQSEKELGSLLPDELKQRTEAAADKAASHIQQMLVTYVDSYDGRRKIQDLVQSFLQGRGFLGSMLSSFMDPSSAVDKIQPVIIESVGAEGTRRWLHQLLADELNKLMNKKVGQVTESIGQDTLDEVIQQVVRKSIPFDEMLDTPIQVYMKDLQDDVIERKLTPLVGQVLQRLSEQIPVIMEQLELAKMVEKEVSGFPLERVEELVLAISNKEFKLITYLGFLLGGIIGIVQGIIALFI